MPNLSGLALCWSQSCVPRQCLGQAAACYGFFLIRGPCVPAAVVAPSLPGRIMDDQRQTRRSAPADAGAVPHWRFQDLEIWQRAADLAVELQKLAGRLDERKIFPYPDQLRSAGMAVATTIAGGSSSSQPQEFHQALSQARRNLVECAALLMVFHRMGIVQQSDCDPLLSRVDLIVRKLSSFMKSLRQE